MLRAAAPGELPVRALPATRRFVVRTAAGDREVLEVEWEPATLRWWEHVCSSEMAAEYLEVDWDGLRRLAGLVDNVERTGDLESMKEIRLQGALYGLTPVDRARLHWEVEKGDQAASATRVRRSAAVSSSGRDPRLRAVK